MSDTASLTRHRITVLLVDDQHMIGEALRRMLAPENDIDFHFCQDPTKAIKTANRIHPTVILQDLVMARNRRLDPGPILSCQCGDPPGAVNCAFQQGRGPHQGGSIRPRRQRLYGQTAGPSGNSGTDPISLSGLH